MPEHSHSEQSASPLVAKGVRRLHLNTGEVWRVLTPPDALPPAGAGRRMVIAREADRGATRRAVDESYWLGDSWGRPHTEQSDNAVYAWARRIVEDLEGEARDVYLYAWADDRARRIVEDLEGEARDVYLHPADRAYLIARIAVELSKVANEGRRS